MGSGITPPIAQSMFLCMKHHVLKRVWPLGGIWHHIIDTPLYSAPLGASNSESLPRPRRGLRGIVFTRSVCLSVCVSVCLCVCPANILVFYFSAIRRDIDLKFIQDTYRVVLNSLKIIDLHRSKVKVTGTVHCFLKVQSYHKNWAIEKCQFFHRHLLGYSIRWNNKNSSEQRNDVTKNTSIFDFNM